MKDGFIKVKAVSPQIFAGDVNGNASKIKDAIDQCERMGVKILVTPELCLCGYSSYDLIATPTILSACKRAIEDIKNHTQGKDILVFIGAPLQIGTRLFSCAIAIKDAQILGICTPNTISREQGRIFSTLMADEVETVRLGGKAIEVSGALELECTNVDGLTIGVEIGANDLYAKNVSSSIVCHLGSGFETLNSEEQRRLLVKGKSLANNCAYIMANPPSTETTTDVIYGAHNIICENGIILAQARPFEKKNGECVSEIDAQRLQRARTLLGRCEGTRGICFEFNKKTTIITRKINPYPFKTTRENCEKALEIQARALARRIEASYSKKMVIGISGGLDSTIALVAVVKCADLLEWERDRIVAVTMPCFGTTSRTKSNAIALCQEYGVDLREIDISQSVRCHLNDIDHDEDNMNVTYENAQARERTQVLMDIANDENGLVVGTGDLSEIALGWCTYNADHMSMYNVNSTIPKTLVRQILSVYAEKADDVIRDIIYDVLDTPVSPELLPADENGEIAQKTEESVGSYDLNDFFLYNMIYLGFMPSKTYRLACIAFEGKAEPEQIYESLERFIKRFFSQQFKRSCSPDGVQVTDLSLSPRGGGFRMASDMSAKSYLEELNANA